ncbi:MAG: hypothetical protein AAGC57_19505 [Pseudomonadota bacterium]
MALVRLTEPADAGARTDPSALLATMGERGVHELAEARFGDMTALGGLAAAVLAAHARPGPILWITEASLRREHGRLSARGAQSMGLDPGRLLTVAAPRPRDALWCIEEGLRSGAVAAVVAALSEADFTATRRLTLASEAQAVPAILLMPHRREGATAAEARWRLEATPSAPNRYDPKAPGKLRWRAVLERSRRAPWAAGRRYDLEFDDATLSLHMAHRLAPRPPRQDQAPLHRAL